MVFSCIRNFDDFSYNIGGANLCQSISDLANEIGKFPKETFKDIFFLFLKIKFLILLIR